MKLAVVVQRYGAQINGGAELHARYIVELLAKHHTIEVLTTCARDYVTWHNEYPEGTETLRGVPIRRFAVSQERNPEQFGRDSVQVFERPHSLADELAWLESEGPTSPALIAHLREHDASYDYVIFFSYRYYLAYHGIRAVANKAILVPTAERDSALGLAAFGPIFRGVRALMYNSPEERALIQTVSRNSAVPGVVVGVGSDVPRHTSPERFRQKYHLHDPFVLYVGRIDENKGCRELFSYFTSYQPRMGQRLSLVLIGNSILPIPKHSNIRHLGYVSDQDKFDALAAAELLAMPSYYESLSMVALEAWALGKPVLANGRCDVLRGQCIRSRAGLFYDSFDEFAETLFTLTTYKPLTESLGENGRRFYDQHYAWPVIERKYLDILNQLAAEDAAGRAPTRLDALPGWLARRRKTLPPAQEVVKALPHDNPSGTDSFSSFSSGSSGSSAAPTSSASGLRPAVSAAGPGGAAGSGTLTSEPGSTSPERDSRDRRDRDRDDRGPRGERRGRGDRPGRSGDRHTRGDRGDRGNRAARGDRDARRNRDTQGERSDQAGRGDRPPRDDGGNRDDQNERSDQSGRGEQAARGDQADRSERPDRPERSDRGDRGDRGDRDGRRRRRPRPDDGRRRSGGSGGSGSASGSSSEGGGSASGAGGSGGSGDRPRREPGAGGQGDAGSGGGNSGGNGGGNGAGGDRSRRRRRPRGGRPGPRGPREGS